MALRTKTIEYVFPQNEAALAAATRFDFTAKTLNIPENTSRTFRSVIVQISMRQNDAAAASLSSWLIGIKLGAAAFDDATVTDTLNNSLDHASWFFIRDVTSYFTTNFGSGTSQTCQVGLQLGAVTSANHTAKLIITYEYEEQQTRIKTVRIPLESTTGALTTTTTEIGTNQVPNLDSFLPESTKVYRDVWFEVSGNESVLGTVDTSLDLALDAEADDPDAVHESALTTGCWFLRIWERNDMTTSATHAFKAATTDATTGMTFNHLAIVLCVTYEYDHTNSTTILNSLMMPFITSDQTVGRTVAADQTVVQRTFFIEEPSTISLVQSGVLLTFFISSTGPDLNVACGSQADRAYTSLGTASAGQFSLMQRIDSGAAQGVGVSLARGKNTITVECYTTSSTVLSYPLTGILYLNYTSGKATAGDGVHNHTIVLDIMDHAADVAQRASSSVAPNIPEADYWVNNLSILSQSNWVLMLNNIPTNYSIVAEMKSGEGPGDGWAELWSGAIPYGGSELMVVTLSIDASRLYRRYPNDPDASRMALETARVYRAYIGQHVQHWVSLLQYVTYHALTFAISGTVTGSGGGTVNIAAYTNPATGNRELIDKTSRSGNGTYSITWYDNVENVFVEGREDASHVGRSDDGVAA